MIKKHVNLLVATAIGAALFATAASAQQNGQRSSNVQATDLAEDVEAPGEIVVTAQKRAERLLEVPIPVSAINANALLEQGHTRVTDFFSSVPSLDLNSPGNGLVNLAIRGINTSAANNPAVGVTIDDVPYGASTGVGYGSRLLPDLDPAALERVEVLRGPQGTLYGASSIGGLLKYVTKEPSTTTWSGNVQVDVNSVDHGDIGFGLRGSINAPVSPTFAVLASAFVRRDAGYVDNVTTGQKDVNEVNAKGARVAALWRPSDKVSLKASALFQNTNGKGTAEVDTNFATTPTLGDLKQARIANSGDYHIKVRLYSLNGTVDFGAATLTSVTGYGINKYRGLLDVSPQRGPLAMNFYGVPNSTRLNDFETKKFSQEARLASNGHNLIDWTFGLFYNREKTPGSQTIDARAPTTSALVGNIFKVSFPSKLREKAVFAEARVNFTDQFDVEVGGRYSTSRQNYHETDTGLLFPGGVSLAATSKDNAFTFSVSPRYKFSRDIMAYARVASGFRQGGPNPGAAVGFPASYRHDTTVNYEIGIKGTAFDRALTFDLSAFYIDWKDIQLSLRDPATSFVYFANGGKARSRGMEASVQLTPLSGLRISGVGSFNQAKLVQNFPTGLIGFKGDRLPYAPKLSGSLSIEQDIVLSSAVDAFVGGTVSYVGTRTTEFQTRATLVRPILPDYTTIDLRAGVRVGGWNATLYARNMTDKRGLIGVSSRTASNTPAAPYAVNYIQPRTIGLSVGKSF